MTATSTEHFTVGTAVVVRSEVRAVSFTSDPGALTAATVQVYVKRKGAAARTGPYTPTTPSLGIYDATITPADIATPGEYWAEAYASGAVVAVENGVFFMDATATG